MRTNIIRLALLFLVAITLAACDPGDLNQADLTVVCHALIKPIKYNTYKATSGRFAGKTLALDLKQRNEIYTKLDCKSVNGE